MNAVTTHDAGSPRPFPGNFHKYSEPRQNDPIGSGRGHAANDLRRRAEKLANVTSSLHNQQRPTTHHLTCHVKHLTFYLGGKFTQDYLKEAWHEPRIVCLDSATHNLLLGLMPNVTLLDGQLRQNNSLDLSLRAARLLNTKLGLEPYWDE
ncbi:hypothetical protein JTE90_010612 [Oedothorax gibbosus]|uniref:Uncharacterized protein n=1 Tax=Oedothorax gibbosus TaxID=931172 RepID=A0AAV6TRQ9_9ARAC|nr:hypothetical protein JTE90_010612 [Oedothorax gibbosus]